MDNTNAVAAAKNAEISRQILALINTGADPVDALRTVCGTDAVDAAITEIYETLRAKDLTERTRDAHRASYRRELDLDRGL